MTIEIIKQQIINDPENQAMKERGWHPIVMANEKAKLLLIGQAPGIKTQEKGDVFRDKSGDRLRQWLGLSEDFFYSSGTISVLPLDFYFPGKAKTGDLPPRLSFTQKWHPLLLNEMPDIALTVLIGSYTQNYYVEDKGKATMTATVRAYQEYLPNYFPIPHPSPLNFRWLEKNPWFEKDVIPDLQQQVQAILQL